MNSDRLKSWLGPVLVILGIAGNSASVASIYRGAGTSIWIPTVFIAVIIIGTLHYILILKKKYQHKADTTWDRLHLINHNLRDDYYRILTSWQKRSLDQDDLIIMVEKTCKEICDLLALVLSEISSQNIAVCIKIRPSAVEDTPRPTPSEKASVKTLVRSGNTEDKRKKGKEERHPIKGNTDFETIVNGEKNYFAGAHLKKLWAAGEYRNTSEEFYKFYQSAVVAPIRTKESTARDSEEKYDLLGFLCADSKSPTAFGEKEDGFVFYANILKTISDALYAYLFLVELVQNTTPKTKNHEELTEKKID